jgi:hypothetical protein
MKIFTFLCIPFPLKARLKAIFPNDLLLDFLNPAMAKKLYSLLAGLLLLLPFSNAQNGKKNFTLQIGMNFGISQLQHNTRFETTTLHNVYQFTAISHRPAKYNWEDFEEDYDLQQTIVQPRFGLSGLLTYKDWPVFVLGEAMSSTSSYEKMAYSVAAGLGKDFYAADEAMYFSFHTGYKFVVDNGFGSNTIVNSIGNKEARELAATFFGSEEPIGDNTGQLIMVRGGLGKDFGQYDRMRIGAEAYGELDLTDKLQREARMTNIGAQIYLRFKI